MATLETKRKRRREAARRLTSTGREELYKANGDMLSVREQVMRRDKSRCAYCGLAGNTLDHVVPRSKGGRSTLENLVACCKQCNEDKSAMDVEKFRAVLPQLLLDRAAGLVALAKAACEHWLTQQRHDGVWCVRCGERVEP